MKKFSPKLLSSVLLLGSLFIVLGGAINPIHAQTTSSTTIIPPSFELFANPGDTLTEKISIRNEGSQENTYNISTENFEANGDTGQVDLVSGDNTKSYSLAQWLTPDASSIVIKGHGEGSINFTVAVPKTAEPGGHYGAISITGVAGNTPGVANVSAAQTSLILLRVSGNTTEKATVENFSAPSFSEYGPIPLSLKLKNEGNVHIKPVGNVIITDTFGAKVDEFTIDGRNVLPGAERVMTFNWTNKNPIGKYTATLVATYGELNHSILSTTTFIVFPKPLAIGIGIGILAVIFIILLLISGRKRIAKAMKVIAQG